LSVLTVAGDLTVVGDLTVAKEDCCRACVGVTTAAMAHLVKPYTDTRRLGYLAIVAAARVGPWRHNDIKEMWICLMVESQHVLALCRARRDLFQQKRDLYQNDAEGVKFADDQYNKYRSLTEKIEGLLENECCPERFVVEELWSVVAFPP
jgi:hypothetical protein